MWRLGLVLAACTFQPGVPLERQQDGDIDAPDGASVTGELARYELDETSGDIVHDSGPAPALDLRIDTPANVTWANGALEISAQVRIQSAGPATKIIAACKLSNEITIEAWIAPANLVQGGPARVASISLDGYARNVTLGQQDDTWLFRSRNAMTNLNGMPNVTTQPIATTSLAHVVAVQSATHRRIYVDGSERAQDTQVGNFAGWNDAYPLMLANEGGTDVSPRYWLGAIHRIVIYRRALTDEEIAALHERGP